MENPIEDFEPLNNIKKYQYLDKFLLFEKYFKVFNEKNDVPNMVNCLTRMKILQGKMLAKLHRLIAKLNVKILEASSLPIKRLLKRDVEMYHYENSVYSTLIDHTKRIIKECEEALQGLIQRSTIEDQQKHLKKSDVNNDRLNIYENEPDEDYEIPLANHMESADADTENILMNKKYNQDLDTETLLLNKVGGNSTETDEEKEQTSESSEIIPNEQPKELENDKVKQHTPTVILFYAEWCGPSQKFLPIWKSVKDMNYNGNVDLFTLECGGKTDYDKKIVLGFNVEHFPMVKLCRMTNGKKVISKYTIRNSSDEKDLIKWIRDETGFLPEM
jgi:thiol-disulfide isomerase/thioredoxin